jgi:hypothetical protein
LGCGDQVSGAVWYESSQPEGSDGDGREGGSADCGGDTGVGMGMVSGRNWNGMPWCRGSRSRSLVPVAVRPSVPLPLAEGVKDDRPRHSVPTGNATVPRKRSEGRAAHLFRGNRMREGSWLALLPDRTDD